jgi:hypothetical protein
MNNSTYLSSGCDLWVLINDSQSYWWNEINFHSSFLLSTLKKHESTSFTRSVSNETDAILLKTEFPKLDFKSKSKLTFIASQNHFSNRWICLMENISEVHSDEFINNVKNLKCKNIRFFFETDLPAGLKTSFPNAEFISDSQ